MMKTPPCVEDNSTGLCLDSEREPTVDSKFVNSALNPVPTNGRVLRSHMKREILEQKRRTFVSKFRKVQTTKRRQAKEKLELEQVKSSKKSPAEHNLQPQPTIVRKRKRKSFETMGMTSSSESSLSDIEDVYHPQLEKREKSLKLVSEQTRLIRDHIDKVVESEDEEIDEIKASNFQSTIGLSQRFRKFRRTPHWSQYSSSSEFGQSQRISIYDSLLKEIFSINKNKSQDHCKKNANSDSCEPLPTGDPVSGDLTNNLTNNMTNRLNVDESEVLVL